MDPTTFKGEPDPIAAEEWLEDKENILESLQLVDDDLKMATAPFYLKGEAAKWWKGKKVALGRNRITWEAFKELFLDQYFPDMQREKKREEFMNLT